MFRHHRLLLIGLLWIGISSRLSGSEPTPGLVMANRTIAQDQGAWVVDYRLRNVGSAPIVVSADRLSVKVESWVSNSRIASHAVPRHSLLTVAGSAEPAAECKVIASPDEEQTCREKLVCRLSAVRDDGEPAAEKGQKSKPPKEWTVPINGIVSVQLRLEHHHVIFGEYDPLLGVREVEIGLAGVGTTIRDRVGLDREHYLAQPRYTWPEPPETRRDPRHSLTGPDSLHLEAHVPGHHYYRYPDRPVRYATPMRLKFSYLIAAGTEGECRFRVAQYKETPATWRMINEAGFEESLKVVGRWTEVEHIFTTDAESTTLALDFRISGDSDIGEMWIDDVSLEPVGCPGRSGP